MADINFSGGKIYPQSQVTYEGNAYALARVGNKKQLLVLGNHDGFRGSEQDGLLVCDCSAQNASTLRKRIPWLNPAPLGRATSFGFGDRLGLATPGHIASVRAVMGEAAIAPIYAQQSVRENDRTARTPQNVVDDATWGVFQEGWRDAWGADADHIKEIEDLPPFTEAGYTFYTIDPSDHVDSDADFDSIDTLKSKVDNFPWNEWGVSYDSLRNNYGQSFVINELNLTLDEETLLRAVVKYGRAILHTAAISKALSRQMGGTGYDLEMSVDETDTPTSIHEHYFIANELLTRGIPVVSLAPRFVGKFQKGVDYMGDLAEFEVELIKHMAILHHFGKYKISVHTGSDKFSIYGIVNQHARGYVHVKTAGTSYLEALRVAANLNPTLFRQCLDLAHERFQIDRKSYYLDCEPAKVPASKQLSDQQLPQLLEDESFDARQLLHVTFGSVLDVYGEQLTTFLEENEDAYRQTLKRHFERHLRPIG